MSGVCFADGHIFKAANFEDVDVLDRVGSGDAFAAGLIFGILTDRDLQNSINLAAASGVLALASCGDASSATLAEIESIANGSNASTVR